MIDEFDECENCGLSLEFEYDDPVGILCNECHEAYRSRLAEPEADFDFTELGGENG